MFSVTRQRQMTLCSSRPKVKVKILINMKGSSIKLMISKGDDCGICISRITGRCFEGCMHAAFCVHSEELESLIARFA